MIESLQELSLLYLSRYPQEAAISLEKQPPKEAVQFLRDIPTAEATKVIVYLSPEKAWEVIDKLQLPLLTGLFEELPVNKAAMLLRKRSSRRQSKIINSLSANKQKQLKLLLAYEKDTAGGSMDPNPLVFVEDEPVANCLERVRNTHTPTPFFYFYILDREGNVTGQCNLHSMINQANTDCTIGEIKKPVKYLVSGRSDINRLVDNEELSRYGSLPVIDESGLFIGVIYQSSLIDEGDTGQEGAFNETTQALGEVFSLGISGVFQSLDNRKRLG